jgi:hypothetical protein
LLNFPGYAILQGHSINVTVIDIHRLNSSMRRFLPFPVWLYAFIVATLLSVPYLAGAANTPEGWLYSGAAVVPGGFMVDYNSHMAKMRQGVRGEWDYHLLFTHEAHPGLTGVQSFYIALGALAYVAGLSLQVVYHLARFVLTIVMILVLWRFVSCFFARDAERWTAMLFATLVTGVGWILYFFAPLLPTPPAPIEFWLMDAYNLTGAFYMPHFSAAIVLQMLAVMALMDFLAAPGVRPAPRMAWLTLLLVLLVLIQPYVVLLTFPLTGLLVLYDLRQHWRRGVLRPHLWQYFWLVFPAGIHGGLAIWQFLLLRSDPVWVNFTAQNITLSPSPDYYALGYLPFLIPIVYFAFSSRRSAATGNIPVSDLTVHTAPLIVPGLWVIIVAVLLYAPLPTQRRYLLGVQTPLAILATAGWSYLITSVKPHLRPMVAIPYFVLAGVALLLMLTGNLLGMTPAATPAAFYSPDELAGYAWLRENASPDALVLTTLDGEGKGSGGRLVAMTGMRVYLGHWIETADFLDKVDIIRQFYQPETEDAWRRDLLQSTGVQYVWYDDYARAFGTWSPEQADYLEAVFSSETVTLYRVERDE